MIKLTDKDRLIAEKFADIRLANDGQFYKSKRGAFKREDIVCGALAEIGAFKHLVETTGKIISYPDFTVHGKKSYGADLIGPYNNYHVKGQTKDSVYKYGNSYLFQKSDKLVSLPGEDDFIICCVVDLHANTVEVVAELPALNIKWGKPRIQWLEKTKVALYIGENV